MAPPMDVASIRRLSLPPRSRVRSTPLVGAHVRLAPIEPADGPELWLAVNASRAHLERWLPWVPFNDSLKSSQRYADACVKEWDEGKSLRFGIRATSDNSFLGVVSLDNCGHAHKNCDLGYWLHSEVTGHGYLTEAARACLRFAFEVIGFHRVRCAAATKNHKSLAVISRLGFAFEGISREAEFVGGRWVDHAMFSLLAKEWQS